MTSPGHRYHTFDMTPPNEMCSVAQNHLHIANPDSDYSTAPTTPDESFTSSPALQASKLQDALECEAFGATETNLIESLGTARELSSTKVKKICCIGAGYVEGGPTAAVMAYHNPKTQVTVVDRDISRIAKWNSKHPPLYEPGLYDILRVARDGSNAFRSHDDHVNAIFGQNIASLHRDNCSGRDLENLYTAREPNLFFSTDIPQSISEADMILIAVNTPTKMKGIGAGEATDMTTLEAVIKEIAVHAKSGAILVEKSTVPCRTVDLIKNTVHRPGLPFEVLSNPEFLSAGTAVSDLLYPSRVLIGNTMTPSGLHAARLLRSVYCWVAPSAIISTNVYSAELAKLVANAMLAQRISSINSISALCERLGADVSSITQATVADPRIGTQYLNAGVGFGGSCFEKDIRSLIYLAKELGLLEVADYWQQVLIMNKWQMSRFGRRVVEKLNGTLVEKKIAVLGYAFKKGTDDMRESPALEVIKILIEEGPKEIAIFDLFCKVEAVTIEIGRQLGPQVLKENGGPIKVYQDVYEACRLAHATTIMSDCDEFRSSFPGENKSAEIVHRGPHPYQILTRSVRETLLLQQYIDMEEIFVDEPVCEAECTSCAEDVKGKVERKKAERIDWARVACQLEMPKLIFDGRGVLDVVEMEKLGVKVESIGR